MDVERIKNLGLTGVSSAVLTAECQAERGDEFPEPPNCTIKGMGLETPCGQRLS